MSIAQRQLGNVATVFIGLPTRASDLREVDKQTGQLGNILTVRALTGTGIDLSQLYEADLGERADSKYRARVGDIVISARSTTIKSAVVPQELDGVIINATLAGIRCGNELVPGFLAAYLQHPEGSEALTGNAQSGSLIMSLTVSGLSQLEIPVPPLDVQRRIAAIVEAADDAYRTAVAAAEKRRELAHLIAFKAVRDDRGYSSRPDHHGDR